MPSLTHLDLGLLTHLQRLAHTLHPIIVATFLDCAPAAFGLGSTNPTELELIASVTDICRSLYGAILQEESFVRSGPYSLVSKVLTRTTGEFQKRFQRTGRCAWSHGGLLPVYRQRGQAGHQGVFWWKSPVDVLTSAVADRTNDSGT